MGRERTLLQTRVAVCPTRVAVFLKQTGVNVLWYLPTRCNRTFASFFTMKGDTQEFTAQLAPLQLISSGPKWVVRFEHLLRRVKLAKQLKRLHDSLGVTLSHIRYQRNQVHIGP